MNKILLINKIDKGYRIACSNGDIHDILNTDINSEIVKAINSLNKEKILILLYGEERKDIKALELIEYKDNKISNIFKYLFQDAKTEKQKDIVILLNNFYKKISQERKTIFINYVCALIEQNSYSIFDNEIFINFDKIKNIKFTCNGDFVILESTLPFCLSFSFLSPIKEDIQKSFRINPFLVKTQDRFLSKTIKYNFMPFVEKRNICPSCGYEILYGDNECKFCKCTEKIYM